MSPGAKGL
ncbi:unnamed protein product, partial [Didymodactylos carnosus]